MIAAGHVNVDTYTIGTVWEENELVVDRNKKGYAAQAQVMRAVVNAALASFGRKGRESATALQKMIEDLHGDGDEG